MSDGLKKLPVRDVTSRKWYEGQGQKCPNHVMKLNETEKLRLAFIEKSLQVTRGS